MSLSKGANDADTGLRITAAVKAAYIYLHISPDSSSPRRPDVFFNQRLMAVSSFEEAAFIRKF
jgi:hypothetical protein